MIKLFVYLWTTEVFFESFKLKVLTTLILIFALIISTKRNSFNNDQHLIFLIASGEIIFAITVKEHEQ